MKTVNVIIKDELKRELKNFAHQVCVGAAAYTRDTLTNTAYGAFERFYCDYTPKAGNIDTTYEWKFFIPDGRPIKYKRTYNVLINGIEKFYEDKHRKIVRGGVRISPENMDDVYKISATEVFDNIYKGYHGFPEQSLPAMNPSPEEIIDNELNELISNDNCSIMGISRAKKVNYGYLHW